MKDRILDTLDAKIRILQATQSCVRAAATMDTMKSCHEQERDQMKGLMEKERSEHQAMKAQRGERPGPPPGSGPR